ncbi:methylated-DNA--[protein]-cysteine S-methyltransferase [Caenimonas terrae]|uniref:Methylated-DNA--[protein]-cysteine S-methyltransferase n=1 Tax=Caenimonas terrae TaxID=696074 RepID=A0ABW0NKI0_9BURK
MHASGFCLFDTPIGQCAIAWSAAAIVGVLLPEDDPQQTAPRMQRRFPQARQIAPPHWVAQVIERTRALLNGATTDTLADVPLDMAGVPEFNQRVYAIARAIAPGQTLSYGEVAAMLGEPGAARAVGQALGHNPFAPIVPCHRVLAAGKRSGGFSAGGGVATKLRMLQIEKAQLGDGPGLFD